MDATLRDPVLVGLIVEYQHGWWHDSAVFRNDPLLFASDDDLAQHVAVFGERFVPWLARRGLTGAINLMSIYPPLVPCIALHAAATGNHPLGVAAINNSNDISSWVSLMSDTAGHFGHCNLFASNGIPVSIKGALTSGNVALVRQLHDERGPAVFKRYIEDAIRAGHLAVVRFLHEEASVTWPFDALGIAVQSGHQDIAAYLQERGHQTDIFSRLETDSLLEEVTNLHAQHPTTSLEHSLEEAASEGLRDVIKFILATGTPSTPAALQAAAKQGHLECFQVLLAQRPQEQSDTYAPRLGHDYMDACASVGRLDLVRKLHNAGHFGCSKAAMDCAAANGHLDVVTFLHEHRGEGCSVSAIDKAAGNNHLAVVKYLHATVGIQASRYAIAWAAMGGHDHIVRYLYEAMKAPVLDDVPERAARGGHLPVVRYLHEQGLGEWTPRVMDLAVKSGNIALVAFLHAHRADGCTPAALDAAVVHGDVAMVRLLHDVVGANAALCSPMAMRQGTADVLLYLASLGVDVVRTLRASAPRFVALIEYLEYTQARPPKAKKQRTEGRMQSM
ncbi:hypothetical protein SDRG_04176 [Saprolegnia diclina VS20]|uniref:Uncharacterized protein n=1 Tax=Saprolegnia diclina (strain VS20) TaxID=1156394 RepID=T0S0P1_SAPDV|nr:hypothetical protein SDRG_04176 [Saprolegnia diclina VS20]EQC38468.1 hypothetical protein SDRG_04176 [Saprolegnia diclina VS20]|eukprot:XP_008608060.1 hypothetical protein SDRG_04176 [Saprolegnia diclina VS20]